MKHCIIRRSSNAPRQPLLGYKINGEAIGGACGKHGTEKNANGGLVGKSKHK